MTLGTHGSTFGGNALAMAVANAVLDVILEHGFLERVPEPASAFISSSGWPSVCSHPRVVADQVRGEGLLVGIQGVLPPNRDVLAGEWGAD